MSAVPLRCAAAFGLALLLAACAGTPDAKPGGPALRPLLTAYREARPGVVTGSVSYLQRVALPPDAELQVQLVDDTRADAPATVLAERRYSELGKPPFVFELATDPARIDPRHHYSVRAGIRSGGQLHFVNHLVYPALTRGAPAHLDLIVEPVRPQS